VRRVRLAVVGAGEQSTGSLMPSLPFIEEIDLVAVCDLKRDLAARNARNFGAAGVYVDVSTMLAEQRPDAVLVVGPPQIHEELGLQALEAGCHLFVEKPSSPSVAGAKRLADAAQRAGRRGQVGHMMRHAAPIRIARDLVQAPEFGTILSVRCRYTTWPTPAMPAASGWGGAEEDWAYMLNQGGHPIDLLRHFAGDVVRVAGFAGRGRGAAKVFQVAVECAGGTVGVLDLQDSFDGWTTALEVVGDGLAVVSVDDLGRVARTSGERRTPSEADAFGTSQYVWEPHHTLPPWKRSGYGTQLCHFARCILDDCEPTPSLADAWRNLVVAEAILQACATRTVVECA
jgi:predicted dehydrogenase